MKPMIVVAAFLGLSACSTAPPPPPSSAPPTADACNARGHQHLVGRPRSEIPVPAKPELHRVACLGCPITMDYNPQRLNFFFDAATGIIKEVRCG